jgi:hypothetical protein
LGSYTLSFYALINCTTSSMKVKIKNSDEYEEIFSTERIVDKCWAFHSVDFNAKSLEINVCNFFLSFCKLLDENIIFEKDSF